jgi:hypothetical protein
VSDYEQVMYEEMLSPLPVYGPITLEQYERAQTMRIVNDLWRRAELKRMKAEGFWGRFVEVPPLVVHPDMLDDVNDFLAGR